MNEETNNPNDKPQDDNNSDSQQPNTPEPQPVVKPEDPTPSAPKPVAPKPPEQPKQLTPEEIENAKKIVTKPISRTTSEEPQPATPIQPVGGRPQPQESIDRRTFIKWVTVGWAAFAAIVGGYGTLVMRYLFPNVLFEPKQSFRAGYPDDYPVGEVSERWKAQQAVWIVRDSEKIYALSTVCTHLGCTPNWLSSDNKFKCPCHGSGFYKTGINFEGPAPRPLERFKIALSDDGEIIVDKTQKFQQEKGEWDNPESYILV